VALRVQMTQRGKMVIVTLDDASATVDVTVYSEIYDANKRLFKEDEFLCVSGKVSEDRFSGGLRITAEKVMDIAAARIQYGKQITLTHSGKLDAAQIKSLLTPYRSETGLPFLLHYTQAGAACELRLADEWKVLPADGLKQALADKMGSDCVEFEYF
jgi:DNA polymerase-3 subunit alpha